MSNDNEGEEVDKLLTLEEAVEGVRKIVEANPDFRYPMQDEQDPRCKCVERDTRGRGLLRHHDPSDCPGISTTTTLALHRYNTQPACVLGHYFAKN